LTLLAFWIFVRTGHPLSEGAITPARYAAAGHIHVTRRGDSTSPIDDALAPLGLDRKIAAIVGGFSAALALARASDLVASVPERHTGTLRDQMHSFALPLPIPQFTVSLLWHPRMDGDAAHRWLRGCVRDACADQLNDPPTPRRSFSAPLRS
jgi:DNA-binding transcriptional LysR family regulator